MINFQKTLKKTLLYNLILFDFILLESSTKKISNFFIEKFEVSSQKNLKKKHTRLSLEEVAKSFKRYIRLFQFLKNNKKKNLVTLIGNSDQVLELLKILFKQYKLSCFINLTTTSLSYSSKKLLKSVVLLEYPLTKSNFLSLFFKNFLLLQSVNSFEDSLHYSTYKIFSSLDDYKKLIFLSLILVSIFKK